MLAGRAVRANCSGRNGIASNGTQAGDRQMKLTWFGHSAFRVEIAGAVILIDPFLDNPLFQGDKEQAYAGTTHVVVTHGHDDHIGSTLDICKATGATLISNFEVCMYLHGQGVEKFSPGNHGGHIDFGTFGVSFVQAWHSSSVMADGKPVYLGNPAGVVLTAKGEKTLLHMGDTDIFSDMKLIDEIYQPKIGIVPIGDRFTMGAKLAAMACRKFYSFETAIPAHYATFGLIDPSADKFVAEMKGAKTEVLVPEVGVPFEA
jgi:L-ascorbate metabolism protein UlaG (beta-lactamase superfamily)